LRSAKAAAPSAPASLRRSAS